MRRLVVVIVASVIMEWHSSRTMAAPVPTPPLPAAQAHAPPVAPPRRAPAPARVNCSTAACTPLLIFGDSTVDPGNNNRLRTTVQADFLPYGINFYGGKPTGRFCDGRLVTDILAEKLGISKSIPAFLDPKLKLEQLKKGVSFGSAGSGYDDITAKSSKVLPFSKQIEYLWHYKLHLQKLVGARKAERLVKKATFVISAGTNDLLYHYIFSNQSERISLPQYENYLISRITNYTKVMKRLGGRRFIFVGVPPMGCLPLAKTLLGTGADKCDENLNRVATSFNSKLVEQLGVLKKEPRIKALYINIYTIMAEATKDPKKFGLSETSKGCCGTGQFEFGEACKGQKTCTDPSKYLYWDAVHPTDRMYQIITDDVIMNSIGEIFG